MSQQFRPGGFSMLPPVVKNLLIVNGLMFLATYAFQQRGINLSDTLALHFWEGSDFRPYQFITYMFMHGSIGHLFSNMFSLWMFGHNIENIWGPKKFAIYYLITGFGAGLIHYAFSYAEITEQIAAIQQVMATPDVSAVRAFLGNVLGHDFVQGLTSSPDTRLATYRPEVFNTAMEYFKGAYQPIYQFDKFGDPVSVAQAREIAIEGNYFLATYAEMVKNGSQVVGASGSVFGIILAFGMMFPNAMIIFPLPMKVKYFVILYGAYELYQGVYQSGDGIAHFAHLGGMLFGLILLKYWGQKRIV